MLNEWASETSGAKFRNQPGVEVYDLDIIVVSIGHQPCNPDLVPNDFHQFPTLKRVKQKDMLDQEKNMKTSIKLFFRSQDTHLFSAGDLKPFHMLCEYVSALDDFIEQYCKTMFAVYY